MSKSEIFYANYHGTHIIKLVGDIRLHTSKPLDDFYRHYLKTGQVHDLILDLTDAQGIDSTGLGLLAQLAIGFTEQIGKKPALVSVSKDIQRILTAVHFDQLFIMVNSADMPVELKNLSALDKTQSESDREIAERVLEAHRILVSLSEANKQEFQSVVEFLEKELKK